MDNSSVLLRMLVDPANNRWSRIELLAGVYTLSFLGVMALFGVGNMLLKIERARLPREIRATWPAVILGFIAVCAALAGNILLNPAYVRVFAIYFAVALIIVGLMFRRSTASIPI